MVVKNSLKRIAPSRERHYTPPGYTHKPWGFMLEDISLDRVYFWYGEIDVDVPVSMGRAMANAIAHCKAKFYPNETHLSVIANYSDEIMEAMSS